MSEEVKKNYHNLTEKELTYLQGLEMGMSPQKAGAYSQVANLTMFLERANKKIKFTKEVKRITDTHRSELTMTRSKVQKIVMEAIDMASVIGDPNAMIRGAAELNKMCGFYAPETKVIELSGHAKEIRASLEALDDGALLELLERDEKDVIDIDFSDISEPVEIESSDEDEGQDV